MCVKDVFINDIVFPTVPAHSLISSRLSIGLLSPHKMVEKMPVHIGEKACTYTNGGPGSETIRNTEEAV